MIPTLKEVGEMIQGSSAVCSYIASGLLSDFCPNLKRIRQLMFEKNWLQELWKG